MMQIGSISETPVPARLFSTTYLNILPQIFDITERANGARINSLLRYAVYLEKF